MQLNIPSLVQAPVRAPEDEVDDEPVPAGATAEVTEVGVVGTLTAVVAAVGTAPAAEVAAKVAAEVAAPVPVAIETKTPPGSEVAVDAGAVPYGAAALVAPLPVPVPVGFTVAAPPAAVAQEPVGPAVAVVEPSS